MYVTADHMKSMKNKQFDSYSKCIVYTFIITKNLSLILRGLRAHERFGVERLVIEMQNSKSCCQDWTCFVMCFSSCFALFGHIPVLV